MHFQHIIFFCSWKIRIFNLVMNYAGTIPASTPSNSTVVSRNKAHDSKFEETWGAIEVINIEGFWMTPWSSGNWSRSCLCIHPFFLCYSLKLFQSFMYNKYLEHGFSKCCSWTNNNVNNKELSRNSGLQLCSGTGHETKERLTIFFRAWWV